MLKNILIANSDEAEIMKIQKAIQDDYIVEFAKSPDEARGKLENCDFMLLDQNFTKDSGIDFLMDIQGKTYFPIVVVTSPEDSLCAFEALRLGAHNYLVKMKNYHELIKISIKEAFAKYTEKEEMKNTIIHLKQQVTQLEQIVAGNKNVEHTPEPKSEKEALLKEIKSRFNRGEINIPSYPQINIKFKEMLRKGASVDMISDLLKKDVGISSKLISLSNSSFYRGISENKSVEQAVSRLGLIETKKIVSMISNRSLYSTDLIEYKDLFKNLWEHSMACAYASEIVSESLQLQLSDEIFTMGLLHDVGKLLLLQVISELDEKGIVDCNKSENDILAVLSTSHGKFGAALLKKWGFGKDFIEISLYHNCLDKADSISKSLLIVHFANLMVQDFGIGKKSSEEIDFQNLESAKLLKISPELIADIQERLKERMKDLFT